MFLEVLQPVGVVHDLEVEAPIVVHASLPDVAGFVVFLGSEGGMVEILGENRSCLRKALRTAGGASSKASSTRSVKSILIEGAI